MLLVLAVVLPVLFAGCSKDDDDESKTTYQVFNNNEKTSSTLDKYLDGSIYEVVVYCYIGDDIVRQDNFDKIAPGAKSELKEVPDNFEKIKVSFKFLPKESEFYDLSANTRKYAVAYTLLSKGKNTISELNGETMVGNTLRSSSVQYEWENINSLFNKFSN
ncbi:MAG: hypothetical protein EZS26_000739 [Candidatus Ordinivivax streblomastigis]|uniref:Uncharacterized protein n=1 Tax=Candidatus Ordinivivax streblomastigis TaxID=2540710 RepID=A0A5M8P483_9BACT|nr:MAG: hypothetical protein EZS26_000739 [Candidatus Ordinivivax streblomastigis]